MSNATYKVVLLKQGSPEWLEYRRSHIGASDVAIIMGKNPWKTPYQLWLEKTGRKDPDPINAAMQRGIDMEPIARACLENKIGKSLMPVVIESIEFPYLSASLDAVALDHSYACEIKNLKHETHAETVLYDKIPEYYNIQCQAQLNLLGVVIVGYFSFQSEADNVLVDIVRDNDLIRDMREACASFYDCMVGDYPPEIEEKDYVLIEESKEFLEVWEDYKPLWDKSQELKVQFKIIEKQVKEAEKRLIDFTDGGNGANALVKITQVCRKGSIDTAALSESLGVDESVITKFRKASAHYWKVTPKKEKDNV